MDKEQYLDINIKPIMENLVYQLVCERPEDPVTFMLDWLQKSGGYTANGLTIEERKELETLRKEIKNYREMSQHDNKKEEDVHSDEDDEDNEDEKIETEVKRSTAKEKRTAVSAEVYGNYNKKEDFKPKVISKTNDQVNRIKSRIIQSFLFQGLDQGEVEIVIGAMEEKVYEAGDTVITQGEKGDCLFVVEKGDLDCFKRFTPTAEPKLVKQYGPGDAFGELALLYNSPRAATVKAKTKAILWSLDRDVFNHIVKDAAMKKRDRYEKFLKSVEILSEIEPYELTQICDALKICSYKAGEYVIKENEMGDVFYIIEEGQAVATKTLEPGKQPVEVKNYKCPEYFGELALIKGEPRAANILAKTDLKLVTLDRNSFKRLLGPIEDILKRNSEKYTKFIK